MHKLVTIQEVKQATKGQFKTAAGENDSTFDLLLESIIDAVGKLFADYCARPDFDKKSRTEYLSPRTDHVQTLFLNSPPVAEAVVGPPAIEALRLFYDTATPRTYGAETELVSGTDFFVHEQEGMIEFFPARYMCGGPKAFKCTYTGGYLTDDGANCPEDLKLAALMQAKIFYDRREEISMMGRSLEGSSMTLLSPLTLPKSVTIMLDAYKLPRVA